MCVSICVCSVCVCVSLSVKWYVCLCALKDKVMKKKSFCATLSMSSCLCHDLSNGSAIQLVRHICIVLIEQNRRMCNNCHAAVLCTVQYVLTKWQLNNKLRLKNPRSKLYTPQSPQFSRTYLCTLKAIGIQNFPNASRFNSKTQDSVPMRQTTNTSCIKTNSHRNGVL